MNRPRIALAIVIVAAVIGFAILIEIGPEKPEMMVGVSPNEPVDVEIATASTKRAWLEAAAAAFEAKGIATTTGRPIRIRLNAVLSGSSMQAILDGTMKPAAWSPGSSSWVEEFDRQWKLAHAMPAMTAPCRPTILAPLGIAMWRPMAEALGWPDKPVGWSTIVALAADHDGWKTYGHAEWGRLRLGYPHPGYSNVGMLFMTAMAYGIEGKTSGLAPSDIYTPAVGAAMSAIALETARYGAQSSDLLTVMAEQGPRALHAVAAFENDTVAFNLANAERLQFPIAFVFPSEGTFWTDQPFCVLDGAGWAEPDAIDGARRFLDFLLASEQQALAATFMLRPLDVSVSLGDRLTLANGTDPRATPRSVPAFAEPSAHLMRAVADMFRKTKRKATLLIVIDTSASMAGDKMRSAVAATVNFLKRLDPGDMVGIETFSDSVRMLAALRRMDKDEALADQVRSIYPDGGTALYAAVCASIKTLDDQRRADLATGDNRLYGIVLVSVGRNSTSDLTENEMHETCLRHREDIEPIRINPIAFGEDAHIAGLSRIAAASGGTLFTADPQSIDKSYLNISAEQ